MSVKFYQNFEVALRKLEQFSKQELEDELDKAGLIQGFEFTFEQSWKAIQKAAGQEGVKTASPKSSFSWAMEKGWIHQADEKKWLDMLQDRNLTSHTYREDVANSVVQNIKATYVELFAGLLAKMR